MVHAQIRPDVAGGGDERVMAGEDERHERVVQIHDRRQRVERAFGQRAFGAGAGGGRRFAGHAANHFHEQFRQLHEMNRIVARERADAGVGRIVAAARQHGGDGRVQRLARRHAAAQARGNFRQIRFAGADEVGPLLEIARIFRRLAVHEARVGGADEIIRLAGLRDFAHELLHRLGELVEAQRVLDHVPRVRGRERLVVGKEILRLDEIVFRLLVVAAMNRVVGPLEQTLFAVLHEFQRQIFVRAFRQIFQRAGRNDRGRRDVVFHLHFHRRMKILAQAERAPRAVVVKADAQIRRHELAVVAFQFVAGRAVDDVHAEMVAPVAVPLRLVIALHDEDEFLDVLRHGRRARRCIPACNRVRPA